MNNFSTPPAVLVLILTWTKPYGLRFAANLIESIPLPLGMSDKGTIDTTTMPNYVLKMKQNRYGEWIADSIRVQGDTIKQVNVRLNAITRLVQEKSRRLNND